MERTDEEDDLREEASRKANFCLATGIAPSEYDTLTYLEIEEFIREHNRLNKK